MLEKQRLKRRLKGTISMPATEGEGNTTITEQTGGCFGFEAQIQRVVQFRVPKVGNIQI